MENLVSICIPVFNGGAFLAESIESVTSQTHPNVEIIIVDDCSSDDSVSIAKKYAKQDSRIKIIQNTHNLGLVGNWNKCIELANGEWFKLHFQDDLMDQQCISTLLSFAIENECNLVLSDRNYFFEAEVTDKQKEYYQRRLKKINSYITETRVVQSSEVADIFTKDFLGHNFLGEPIVGLCNRNLFKKYSTYDPDLKQICDFEFWLRIVLNERFGYVNEPLTNFRVHGSSQTSKNKKDKKNNHAVSIRVTDRIQMGLKMVENDFYQKYREYISTSLATNTHDLLSVKFTEFIVSTGYFTSKKFFHPGALEYFSYKPTDYTKALYSDFSRMVSSTINSIKQL